METHNKTGTWKILSLGVVIGGGLMTAVLATACPNGVDGFGEPETDERYSPLPFDPNDDFVDTKASACVKGWRPLGVIEGIGDYTSMAADGRGTLALATDTAVEMWDVRTGHSPRKLATIQAAELGAFGGFGEIAAADWGFVVLGVAGMGDRREHMVVSLEPEDTPVIQTAGSFKLPPQKYPSAWKVGSMLRVDDRVSRVAASGGDFVAAGVHGVYFGERGRSGLLMTSRHDYGHGDTPIHANAVALDGDKAIVTSSSVGITILSMRPSGPVLELDTLANPQAPVRVGDGWIIPETNHPTTYFPPSQFSANPWGVPGPDEGPGSLHSGEAPQPGPDDGPGSLHSGTMARPGPDDGPGSLHAGATPRPGPDDGPGSLHAGAPARPGPGPDDGPGSLHAGGSATPGPGPADGPSGYTSDKPGPIDDRDAVPGHALPLEEGAPAPVVDGGFLEYLSVTDGRTKKLGTAPVISAFDAEDGPFQIVVIGDNLYVANSESGLLRARWSVEGVTLDMREALTVEDWEEMPGRPQRIAHDGTTLFILQPHADAVGVVGICE